ncbi:hypothetical protein [Actinopolyspora mortivallis]|uniref:hypothetical protein n=1 Tax=Actinopolyspora mortivallis TaxID=33906 RepID=UPI0021591284|nr:hypothetical protein [Actinopolyspora mortivallis]
MSAATAPRTVRLAGAVTVLQALAGLVFVVALLIRASQLDLGSAGSLSRSSTYGEAGYFGIISLGVLAAGIGLLRSKHWARTPVLLLQLLLLGVSWYAMGPSDSPLVAFAFAVPAVFVLWCLFNRAGRNWWTGSVTAAREDRETR